MARNAPKLAGQTKQIRVWRYVVERGTEREHKRRSSLDVPKINSCMGCRKKRQALGATRLLGAGGSWRQWEGCNDAAFHWSWPLVWTPYSFGPQEPFLECFYFDVVECMLFVIFLLF